MTKKEAIKGLREIDRFFGDIGAHKNHPEFAHVLDFAIAALNPWRKLSEEKPPKKGGYPVWREGPSWDGQGEYAFWSNGYWDGDCFSVIDEEDGDIVGVSDVTHWAHLESPEKE